MSNNKRPLILIFSAFYEPRISGAERFVKEVAERLASRYRFIILTSRLSRSVPKKETRAGFEIIRLGIGHPIDKWLFSVLAPIHSFRFKPLLIHAVMESYAGIALLLAKVIHPATPRVLTLQSGDLDAKAAQGKIPCWLWRLIHSTPTSITAISNFLANRAKCLGVKDECIRVIPNGADLERMIPRDEAERVPHRLVCLARLSPEKGVDDLIKALSLVRRDIPQAHLIIVGDGQERAFLGQLASEYDVKNHVSFKGSLSHEAAMKELKKAEIFVCPSLAEGLGIVFIEAQALGVPVIGTRVGGIPDVIQDGETGVLVPPGNPESLARAIVRLMKDETERRLLSQHALKHLKRFDWRVVTGQVDELYQELIFGACKKSSAI